MLKCQPNSNIFNTSVTLKHTIHTSCFDLFCYYFVILILRKILSIMKLKNYCKTRKKTIKLKNPRKRNGPSDVTNKDESK